MEVNHYKCYYDREIALYMIYGNAVEQYKKVWDYATTIRKYDEGNNVVMKCERIERPPPLLQRMYLCLQPCQEGFMAGCR